MAADVGRPWWQDTLVALGLAAAPVVALGFTRFAYALLLPPMRGDLDWSYAAAGGMNTANALGYIVGAATAAWWARRSGDRPVFLVALTMSAVALVLTGLTDHYGLLVTVRFAGGVTTAVTFVLGSALASRVASGPHRKRAALLGAVYMAGVGIGVVLSGLLVPLALDHADWQIGWLVLGGAAVLAVVPATLALRRVPAAHGRMTAALPRLDVVHLAPTLAWYELFGAGYVSYMTFIVALLRDQGLDTGATAVFFVVLGAASVVSTLTVWGHLTARLPGGWAPTAVSAVVALGVLPVLLLPSGMPAALLSAVAFGVGFMAGPTAATVIARRALPAHSLTAGIALLTVAFSIGQAAGPLLSGLLSDSSGIAVGLWLSVGLLIAAGLTAPWQRHRRVPQAAPAPPAPAELVR